VSGRSLSCTFGLHIYIHVYIHIYIHIYICIYIYVYIYISNVAVSSGGTRLNECRGLVCLTSVGVASGDM